MELFIKKYFNLLPNEIKIKILLMIESFKPPPKKFNGDKLLQLTMREKEIVIFKMDILRRKYSLAGGMLKDIPTYSLKIVDEPIWCKKNKSWKYILGYGADFKKKIEFYENQLILL